MKKHLLCVAALTLAACDASRPTGPGSEVDLALSNAAGGQRGAVYTLTNAASGNAVLAFRRSPDGPLTPLGSFPTGGNGTGAGLGSQGSVILSGNGALLHAVNAGSNSITSFEVQKDGTLELLGTVSSGGVMPTSLTTHGDVLYVLNAGGSGNITGFSNARFGALQPIPGSTQPLSSGASQPAQVEFDPHGDFLLVTERATNLIGTYAVNGAGAASSPTFTPSAGQTPFGFAFSRDRVVVSEAFGGAPGASAVSSYRFGDGVLSVVSASIPTTETAACWIVITNSGRFTYTTNTGSGSITGYRIEADGSLQILDVDGVTGATGPGSAPIDMALSPNSKILYSTNSGTGTIGVFAVRSDGSLEALPFATGLPVGIVGLAAR